MLYINHSGKYIEINFNMKIPFSWIFQPILHRIRSSIAVYTSRALMDALCEFSAIWINTDGTFL